MVTINVLGIQSGMAVNDLSLALAFLNSRSLEGIPDALASVDAARRWLAGDGYRGADEDLLPLVPALQAITGEDVLSESDVAAARDVRDAFLRWIDGGTFDATVAQLLEFEADATDGGPGLRPAGQGMLALAALAHLALYELHVAGKSQRLRRCEADDCRWVFYDRSRNQSKVWCDMSGCGSRAKARAYRARQSSRTGA